MGPRPVARSMLDALSCDCDACGRPLTEDRFVLGMEVAGGERRAYGCPCGALTVTVVRPDRRETNP